MWRRRDVAEESSGVVMLTVILPHHARGVASSTVCRFGHRAHVRPAGNLVDSSPHRKPRRSAMSESHPFR